MMDSSGIMSWNWKKELEEKKKIFPNENFHVSFSEERIETHREYRQRISERNIGIKSGVIVGVMIGMSIAFFFDALQKALTQFNWRIEIIAGTILFVASIWVLQSLKKGKIQFY